MTSFHCLQVSFIMIPSTPVPASAPTVKTEAPPQVVAILRAMVAPTQAAKNYTWGSH